MLTFNLDSNSKTPLYEQLYYRIRNELETGGIKSGEKLPSKRELASHLKVSVVTVETAYSQLAAEGYITSRPGSGFYAEAVQYRTQPENSSIYIPEKSCCKNYKYNFKTNMVDTGLFPFSTWAKLSRETLSEQSPELLSACDSRGIYELRLEISDYLKSFRGIEVHPDQVIIGAGSEYLTGLIIQLLGRNLVYGIENPGYTKIFKIFNSHCLKILPIPMDELGAECGFIKNSQADAVHITPSHHFPLGTAMPVSRRTEILNWAYSSPNRYIIEDDYDSEFRFSGKPIPTMASIDKNQKVIYMNTFSKTLAPSIRIAYMVLPFELMDKYTKKLDFYSSTVSSFEQYTLAEFIKGGYYERHINRMRNYYKDSRNKIITAIRNSSIYPQISIEEENSGLHFILRIKKNIDDENFKKYLKDKLINISCLTDYCYQYDDEVINEKFRKEFSHKFIINYSEVEESKMVEALKIIEQALKFTAEKDT